MATETSIIKMLIEAEDRASHIFKDVDKSIGILDSSFGGLGGRAASLAKEITLVASAIGALAIAFATFAAKEAAEYETAMANVSTLLTGMQEKDLPKIRDGVLALTRDIPQNAETLANAFYDIQSATGKGAEGLKILETAGKAATGGMTDAKTAAGALVTVLNAYGLEASEAGHVSDVMFGIVKEGVLTYEQLATNIGKVAAPGKAANQTFEQIGAAAATLTTVTGQQEESFVRLNNALAKLQTAEVQEKFSAMGIRVTDLNGKMLPLSEIIQQVSDKQLSYQKIMEALPEKRAAEAVLFLSQNYDTLDKKLVSIENSQGAANEAFEKMMDTFAVQGKIAKNAWEEFLKAVGEPILEKLGPIIQDIIDRLQDLTDWEREGGQIGDTFGVWIDALYQVAQIIPQIFDALTGTSDISNIAGEGFLKWIDNIETIKSILNGVVTLVGGIAMGVAMIHDAIIILASPIATILIGGFEMTLAAIQKILMILDVIPENILGYDSKGTIALLGEMRNASNEWLESIDKASGLWSDNVMNSIIAAKNGIAGISNETDAATDKAQELAGAHEQDGTAINSAYSELQKMIDAENRVTTEAKKASQSVTEIGDSAATAQAEMKAQFDLAEIYIKSMNDSIQTKIEWDAKINIAELEAKTDESKAVLLSLEGSIGSVSSSLSSMFGDLGGALGNVNMSAFDKLTLIDLTEVELKLQKKLVDAQVDYIAYLKDRGVDIKVEVNNAAEWLKGLMGSLFEEILVKAEGEGIKALIGV